MKISVNIIVILTLASLCVMCVEPFDPPEIASPDRILVIEGNLDAPDGTAEVILSTIRNIQSPPADSLNSRVSNAQVEIIINGSTYSLSETNPGVYRSTLPVSAGSSAQLRVETGGKIYESTEVLVKPVPEIDSVTFSADERGVSVEVTTHDPSASTGYYQWSFVETVEYRTKFGSYYYYDGMEVQLQDSPVLTCWKTSSSSDILVATTDGLTEDVVYKFPIVNLPADSWKKEIAYSVLVSQYAISEETYEFLREIENNTENIGTLFDPQPGRIFGNISAVSDPSDYVIGQFSARSVTRKRFFVYADQLPEYPPQPGFCPLVGVDTIFVEDLYNLTQPKVLISSVSDITGLTIIGYTFSSPECMDCRLLRGGTNIEPEFWQ